MESTQARRPLPRFPQPDTAQFWARTADRELCYQVCSGCDVTIFYPRSLCSECGSRDLRMRVSAGVGSIYTATLIRRAGGAFFEGRTPFFLANVDLDEGFRMLSEVVDTGDHTTHTLVGQRVRVVWEEHDGLCVPLFRPG
jgi:hypothetical protein